MPGKVFHVGDAIHRRANEFCAFHNLVRKQWVQDVINRAIDDGMIDPQSHIKKTEPTEELEQLRKRIRSLETQLETVRREKRPVLEAVKKKKGVTTASNGEGDESVFTRPPFWEKDNGQGSGVGGAGEPDQQIGESLRDVDHIPGDA